MPVAGPYPVAIIRDLYQQSTTLPDVSPFVDVQSGLQYLLFEVGRAGAGAVVDADQAPATVGDQVHYVVETCARLGL